MFKTQLLRAAAVTHAHKSTVTTSCRPLRWYMRHWLATCHRTRSWQHVRTMNAATAATQRCHCSSCTAKLDAMWYFARVVQANRHGPLNSARSCTGVAEVTYTERYAAPRLRNTVHQLFNRKLHLAESICHFRKPDVSGVVMSSYQADVLECGMPQRCTSTGRRCNAT